MKPEKTKESILLDQHPNVREMVSSLPEFISWSSGIPTVIVDDSTYYIRGGDMLKEHDQIIVEWARKFRPKLLED